MCLDAIIFALANHDSFQRKPRRPLSPYGPSVASDAVVVVYYSIKGVPLIVMIEAIAVGLIELSDP